MQENTFFLLDDKQLTMCKIIFRYIQCLEQVMLISDIQVASYSNNYVVLTLNR